MTPQRSGDLDRRTPGPAARATRPTALATPRLVLRVVGRNDLPGIMAALADPDVATGYRGASRPGPLADNLLRWQHDAEAWRSGTRWSYAARRRDDGRLVGGVRIARRRLSYFIVRDLWGLGYGGEAVAAVCRHAAEHLPPGPLWAEIMRENIASRRLLECIGFRFRGLAPTPIHGHRLPMVIACFALELGGRATPGQT